MTTLSLGMTLTSLSPHPEQCPQPAANICKILFALEGPLDSSPRTPTLPLPAGPAPASSRAWRPLLDSQPGREPGADGGLRLPFFARAIFFTLTLSYRRQKRLAVRQTSHTPCFRATLASSAQISTLLTKGPNEGRRELGCGWQKQKPLE